MNTKTTLYLSIAFVLLGSLYLVVRSRPITEPADAGTPPPFVGGSAARDVIEGGVGDVVKVVCQRKGKEPWVFERSSDETAGKTTGWRMTSPTSMKCVDWEVNRFATRLGSLRYEISYSPGQAGAPTAEAAGFDTPQATVTLTDADGKSVTVEVGKSPSRSETYVRLAGADTIYVGKASLRDLFKDRAVDYRDKKLFDFPSDRVTRVEITDRSEGDVSVDYVFAKDGTRWMIESPITARATSKVNDLVRAMGRLNVSTWEDDDADKIALYGLDPPARTVRVTVEEEVPVEDEPSGDETKKEEDEVAEAPKTETKVTRYELHLSDRSPIGEDTKVFARVAGETAVGTVSKSIADKFKPVMAEWRDMAITPESVAAANRVALNVGGGSAVLVKKDGAWRFDGDGGRAEDSAVAELLSAVADMTAVVFLDEEPTDPDAFGLSQPRAEIRLTIPGVEDIERIAIGDYTDPQTKRLVYVRRNESSSIAKVRASDVGKLLAGPLVYRDRTIVDVMPSRFKSMALSYKNPANNEPTDVVLQRRGATWRMVEPAPADVRTADVDGLVTALGSLHAERVVAGSEQASAYGLHAPTARLTLTYAVVEETPPESEEASTPNEEALSVSVAVHDGAYYAMRPDRSAIYKISKDVYDRFFAEYRTDRVIDFADDQVRSFSIVQDGTTHTFTNSGDGWVYGLEPDLPLEAKKVANLLLQIRDLRTPRYVKYVSADPSEFGLDEPMRKVTVELDDGAKKVLLVSKEQGGAGGERGHFAAVVGRGDVFLLPSSSVARFHVSLDELESKK